jgi:hypothetical protein
LGVTNTARSEGGARSPGHSFQADLDGVLGFGQDLVAEHELAREPRALCFDDGAEAIGEDDELDGLEVDCHVRVEGGQGPPDGEAEFGDELQDQGDAFEALGAAVPDADAVDERHAGVGEREVRRGTGIERDLHQRHRLSVGGHHGIGRVRCERRRIALRSGS